MKLTVWPLKRSRTLLKQDSTASHLCWKRFSIWNQIFLSIRKLKLPMINYFTFIDSGVPDNISSIFSNFPGNEILNVKCHSSKICLMFWRYFCHWIEHLQVGSVFTYMHFKILHSTYIKFDICFYKYHEFHCKADSDCRMLIAKKKLLLFCIHTSTKVYIKLNGKF